MIINSDCNANFQLAGCPASQAVFSLEGKHSSLKSKDR